MARSTSLSSIAYQHPLPPTTSPLMQPLNINTSGALGILPLTIPGALTPTSQSQVPQAPVKKPSPPKIDIIKSRASSTSSSNSGNSNASGSILHPLQAHAKQGGVPPPPPPPPPSSGDLETDVFGRAKTVRIGKWRWPPLAEEGAAITAGSNFIEFKRKKQIEKQQGSSTANSGSESNFSKSGSEGVSSNSNSEQASETAPPIIKPLQTTKQAKQPNLESSEDAPNPAIRQQHKDVSRKFSDQQPGKLRISMEMRTKLEQLTIDQTVRRESKELRTSVTTSQSMDDLAGMNNVKKLSENRKALLERQLMGSLRSGFSLETTSTPNIKQSLESVDFQNGASVHHHNKKSLSKENSATSNQEVPVSAPIHAKKFIKNQQNILRKSGSREFRDRQEELGPYNRLSSSSVSVSYSERVLYTPERYLPETSSAISSVSEHFDQSNFDSSKNLPRSFHSSANPSKQMEVRPAKTSEMNVLDLPTKNGLVHHKAQAFEHVIEELSHSKVIQNGHSYLHHNDEERSFVVKTKLCMKNEINFYAHSKPKFKLRMRKEVFTPSETIDNPILLDLIFWQIVYDVFQQNQGGIRLNQTEVDLLLRMVKSENILSYNPSVYSPLRGDLKKAVVEAARSCPNYFSRLYVVSGDKHLPEIDYLGVSHAGVNLIKRVKSEGRDELTILKKLR